MLRRLLGTVQLIAAPLLGAGFFVLKVFTIPGCRAFDAADDANHTFVNLAAAHALLGAGELPLINLFNNFGTPLLGDALTYPFALHSVSYALLPYDLAMTANRFVLGFLTILALAVYYRRLMSAFAANVCALLAVLTPGFVWHFAHHHYQVTLLGLATLLLLDERLVRLGRRRDFAYLCGGFALLFLSVSINLSALLVLFLLGHHYVLSRFRPDTSLALLVLAVLAGIAFSFPEALAFVTHIRASARITEAYQGPHLSLGIHTVLPVLSVAILGLFVGVQPTSRAVHAGRVVTLGLIPLAIVFALTAYPTLWHGIPLLRHTDVTRVLWISNVFLLTGVGTGLDALRRPTSRMAVLGAFVYVVCLAETFHIMLADRYYLVPVHRYILLLSAGTGLLFLYSLLRLLGRHRKDAVDRLAGVHASALAVLLCMLPVYVAAHRILGYSEGALSLCRPVWFHPFSSAGDDLFSPREVLSFMEPYSRVAVEADSWLGLDLKVTRDRMFGSGGRSIVLDERLLVHLLNEDLVRIDYSPTAYHFKRPWNADRLAELGIRYVLQRRPDDRTARDGWKLLAIVEGWALYENPMPASVVFLRDSAGNRTRVDATRATYRGNGIQVALPEVRDPQALVATFLNRPGWTARVDGQPRPVSTSGHLLIEVPVAPGDRYVALTFRPIGWAHVMAGVATALLITGAGGLALPRRKSA